MSDTKQKALDFLESNADTNEVFATTDGFLFVHRNDAITHATSLNADDPKVEAFTRDERVQEKKKSPAELKVLKEKAVAEYKEVFGEEPKDNLSGAKIQELVDAKKAELAESNNPE